MGTLSSVFEGRRLPLRALVQERPDRVFLLLALCAGACVVLCILMALHRFAGRYDAPLSPVERRFAGEWKVVRQAGAGDPAGLVFASNRRFQSEDGEFVGRWWMEDGRLCVRYWRYDPTYSPWQVAWQDLQSTTVRWTIRREEGVVKLLDAEGMVSSTMKRVDDASSP